MHTVFPRRNPLVPLIEVDRNEFVFGEFPARISLNNDQRDWLVNLSGDRSTAEAIDVFIARRATPSGDALGNPAGDTAETLWRIVQIGLQSAGLLDASAVPNISRWLPEKLRTTVESEMTHLHLQTKSETAYMIDRRHSVRVHVVGENYLGKSIKSLSGHAGFTLSDSARSASVLVLPSVSHALVSDHDFSERERLPHLHVGIRHTKAVVGPLVIPEETSCLRCDYLHRRDRDPTWPARFLSWKNTQSHSTADPLLIHLTAAFSLSILRNWIDGNMPFNLAWSATLPDSCFMVENRPPHQLCGCRLALPAADCR